jgi:hypothetical protein
VNVGAVMGAGISADVMDMIIPYSAGTEASHEWAVVLLGRARGLKSC